MKSKHYLSTLARRAKATLVLLSIASSLEAAQPAPAGSLSETLEQGIYSEETKGDIDAAMQLYQKVVADSKSGQALAAQAQYHLGVCYYKKKNYAEATATFEKLVKDYPDQKDLVALAQQYLAGATILLPAPWSDGEELQMDVKLGTGFKVGMINYTVNAGEANGQKTWRVRARTYAGAQSFSRVEVEAETFKPIRSRWMHSLLGDVETVYAPDHADLKTKGKDEVKKIELDGVIYDNEEAIQIMRRMPLVNGYKTTARVLSSLSGGTIVPVKLEVVGTEKVEVAAGTYECFKVELSIHQTFWYSTDAHRYLVKFEAGGVSAELSSVKQRKAGEPVSYQDPTFGFSLSAPPEWAFFQEEAEGAKTKASVVILDPDAVASTQVKVEPLEDLKAEAKKSVRDWAEQQAVEGATVLKDLQVRSDSWTERSVAGRPGVSFIGDYVEGKNKKVVYAVFTFGSTKATKFFLDVAPKDFDGFRPKFEAVVDSYKSN